VHGGDARGEQAGVVESKLKVGGTGTVVVYHKRYSQNKSQTSQAEADTQLEEQQSSRAAAEQTQDPEPRAQHGAQGHTHEQPPSPGVALQPQHLNQPLGAECER
jgi:hypothetical protein